MTSKRIEHFIGTRLPPIFARNLRRLGVYPRYLFDSKVCRSGFSQFGHLYPQHTLFVAGLPKSGTSWFSAMLASYPGFHELLIPEQTKYDLTTGGAHDFELPDDMFDRFKNMLVVTKMHVHGSPHNVEVLKNANVKYVVLYRDLRDVAVSEVYYVRRMRWHPEHKYYAGKSVEKGLSVFAQRTLLNYAAWIKAWHQNHDRDLGSIIRYEDILTNPHHTLTQVARHFQLDDSPKKIDHIIQSFQFKAVSGGRDRGQGSNNSFFRKGVAGDWQNYFTADLEELFKTKIGEFLVDFGYDN